MFPKKKKKRKEKSQDFVISRFQEEVYPLLEDTSFQQGVASNAQPFRSEPTRASWVPCGGAAMGSCIVNFQ